MEITFEFVLFTILIYIMIFTIVDRICKCVEHCSTSKCYAHVTDSMTKNKEDSENEQNS